MNTRFRLIFLIFPILILIFGCSGNSGPNTPPVIDQHTDPAVTDSGTNNGGATRFLWGYYEVHINADASEFEVVPVRQVADHWNVLYWLEYAPCTDCFKVTDITPTPLGTLQVFVELRHPFAVANLTGFDVRGIAMSYGTHSFDAGSLITTNRFAGQAELVNADGYTALYNPGTVGSGPAGMQGYIQGKRATYPWPNTTLNGYLRHVSSDDANTRNAFYAGTSETRIYEIYKPAGSFILGYAVDACWAPPINTPVTDPMVDFGPEANSPEPWKIEVTETPVGLGLTSSGGEVVISVDVYDYQGKFSHYVPQLECNELFNGLIYTAYKSTGDGYARFEATVENSKLAPDGLYKCLISVEDIDNAGAPVWLDLTAYHIHELGVGAQAPPMVTGFNVSDADPALANRKVELTWDLLDDSVEWYDIQRLDYDYGTGWFWKQVKSAPHPVESWIDGNPRYCGPKVPLQYRISARNAAGSSPAYATDTGYPKLRRVGIALWCVADNTSGSGAVTSWDRAMADFNDCDTFWNQYGLDFVLENPDGFLWIGDPSYKNINEAEADTMHESYGQVTKPDDMNVYYVNSSNGNPSRAYCRALCPGEFHSTENAFIIMSRDTRGLPPNEFPLVLAHENGHAIAHYWDIYLLDLNGDLVLNDGSSCEATNTWCTEPPHADPLLCDWNAAYQQNPDAWAKTPWNLMWYMSPGKGVADVDLTDAQAVYFHDWILEFKGNYPWPD